MIEEIQLFNNVISLVESFICKNIQINISQFESINKLSNTLIYIYRKEKNKLPYHINILDLLWANENAHSRIFAELLKQNCENKFDILESFYKYLQSLNSNFHMFPLIPKITTEKDRIDVLILDNEYAIIIENKIHNANDQPEQLARYIDKVKSKGYNEKKIWIIYLTQYNNDPENQTWREYKDSFKERFFKISFRYDILPLLEETVLPNCKKKDVYLISTIEQYIDHLKGIFNLRTNQYPMKKELQNHIKQTLELISNPEKDHQILKSKLDELLKVEGYFNELLLATEKECWEKWYNQLKTDFPNYKTFITPYDKKFPKVGITLDYKGVKFQALIEKEDNIYFGFGKDETSDTLNNELQELLNPLLSEFSKNTGWYGWKYTSFENAYNRLKTLIENAITIMKKNV